MKAKILLSKKEFKPIKVELTIETEEELFGIYQRMIAHTLEWEVGRNARSFEYNELAKKLGDIIEEL
jgi:hypothetical protein